MKRIIIIAIIAVLVIGGAAAYYFLIFKAGADEAVTITPYLPGDSFVTNINDSNRLLKTTIVLGLNDAALATTFADNQHVVRDTVIFILRELTEDEIRTVGTEEQIRERIRESLNEVMQTDGVVSVWFNDFVMQ